MNGNLLFVLLVTKLVTIVLKLKPLKLLNLNSKMGAKSYNSGF